MLKELESFEDIIDKYYRTPGRNGDGGRTRSLCFLPRIDSTGFMRVSLLIPVLRGLSQRRILHNMHKTLSPVILVLEDSSIRSFLLFVDVSLQLGSIA
jgi:hypothetical protein